MTDNNFSSKMKKVISTNTLKLDIADINELLSVITSQRLKSNNKICFSLINNVINKINKIYYTKEEPEKAFAPNLKKMKNYWSLFLCYEISIIAFYLDKKSMGRRAAELILFFNGKLDNKGSNFLSSIKHGTITNYSFYNPLVIKRRYSLKYDLPFLDHPKTKYIGRKFNPTNPSIITTENGYRIILRAVNYFQKSGSYFESMEIDTLIRTRNFLIDVDSKFNIISVGEIIDNPKRFKYNQSVVGLEDCRLIQSKSLKDVITFFCTDCETLQHRIPQICICRAKKNSNGDYDVIYHKRVPGMKGNICEKNWIPFSDQDFFDVSIPSKNDSSSSSSLSKNFFKNDSTEKIQFIYNTNPTIIGNYDIQRESRLFIKIDGCGYDNNRMRGSTPIIKFKYSSKEGYLYVVHEVLFHAGVRCYFSRFILLDSNFHINKISDPFFFDHIGIEFCIGLCNSHIKNEVIISYGSEDREAKFIGVTFETLFDMLHPI